MKNKKHVCLAQYKHIMISFTTKNTKHFTKVTNCVLCDTFVCTLRSTRVPFVVKKCHKLIIFHVLTCFCFCFSCENSSTIKKDEKIAIKVDLDKEQDNISFFDIFSAIDIFPLETNDQSVLYPYFDKLSVFNNHFFILDQKQNAVFEFDSVGRFIRNIKKQGRGPGEYIDLCDFNINRFTNHAEFVSPMVGDIHVYSGIKNKHYAAVGSLGSLLIFASMSYPFNVLPFVIVLVFLLAVCVSEKKSVTLNNRFAPIFNFQFSIFNYFGRYATVVLFGVLLAVTVAGSYSRISTYRAYKEWITFSILKISGLRSDALSLCATIYPELKHEIRFLFDYATLLKDDGQYAESNRVLQQGMKISCDPVLYNLAGANFQMMGDYAAAESSFRRAADMVPNRLFPYYLLAKLYVEMGLHDQACEMAKIVLTKEPKVHSLAVDEMREEMKKLVVND